VLISILSSSFMMFLLLHVSLPTLLTNYSILFLGCFRYRKRAKLDDLERRLDIQKSVNSNLMNEREVMRGETMRLRNEVDYLKSVLAKSLAVAQLFGANVKTEPEVPRSFVLSVH